MLTRAISPLNSECAAVSAGFHTAKQVSADVAGPTLLLVHISTLGQRMCIGSILRGGII